VTAVLNGTAVEAGGDPTAFPPDGAMSRITDTELRAEAEQSYLAVHLLLRMGVGG
jgi:hypothetical protein